MSFLHWSAWGEGYAFEARALLDSASLASFISETLANSLSLPCCSQRVNISGIAGHTQNHITTQFTLCSTQSAGKSFEITVIVVPKVTCELPFHPVPFSLSWKHLYDVSSDPQPSRIDILLGVGMYVEALLHGRQMGGPDAPVAFKTEFGLVLAGNTSACTSLSAAQIATHHVAHKSTDDLTWRFWETEESSAGEMSLTPEEKFVMDQFKANHSKKADLPTFAESRSRAVRRFITLERSLQYKGRVQDFNEAITEYFNSGHAEEVPAQD